MNRRLVVFAAIGAVAVGVACSEEHPILTDPAAPDAYGFQLSSSGTNLPRGTAVFTLTGTEQVAVSLSGIDSLDTGFYTAWIGDSLGTSFKPATGLLTAVRQDTALDAIGNVFAKPPVTVNTFGQQHAIKNGGANFAYTWTFTRASSGLVASDSIHTFLISIEPTNTSTTPGSRRVLWARRSEGGTGATTRTANLKFGNYAPLALNEYVFSPTPARGRGAFQHELLLINDSTLARPPIGYYYAAYAIGPYFPPAGSPKSDTVYLGRQKSPWPQRDEVPTQYESDSLITDPAVVLDLPRSILAGSLRIMAVDIGRAAPFAYKGFENIRITLESKNAKEGRMGPARILGGPVPYLIFTGQRQ